jgi:hypothetical protein
MITGINAYTQKIFRHHQNKSERVPERENKMKIKTKRIREARGQLSSDRKSTKTEQETVEMAGYQGI